MQAIPASHRDLLSENVKAIAYFGTIMDSGAPQVTPVWFTTEGEHILINSAEGRTKDRNVRARPVVSVTISDPQNPYRYMQIRGRVVEITNEGARDLIDALAKKYWGDKVFPRHAGEVRVTYKILPERVNVVE